MRIVRHQLREAKTLYDFTLLQQSDGDKNRVLFLSERDMSIIWTAIYFADKVRPRIFYQAVADLYNVVSDEDFEIFSGYVNSLRVALGEWPVSNEYLERIAIALEGINEKTAERLTWDDMIDDLETTLGVGNAFVEILKWIGQLIPSLKAKVDVTPLVMSFWEYYTWKAPILTLLTGANASLAGIAASQLAEKPLSIIRTILAGFDSILNLNNRIYEFVLGDWNWMDDVLKPIWNNFIGNNDGGSGGDNPDNDTENRVSVNLQQQIIDNDVFSPIINMACSPDVNVYAGGGGCSSFGGGYGGYGNSGNGSVIDTDPAPNLGNPSTDPAPAGFGTWSAYDAYKCKAANALFDAVLGFFRFLGGLDAAAAGAAAGAAFGTWLLGAIGATLAAAATTTAAGGFAVTGALSTAFLVGFLATAPGWVIAAIVAAIAAVTAAVGVGVLILFDSLADDFEAKREDVVCQLYNSQTVDEAKGYLSTALADSVASFVIAPPYNMAEAAIRVMMSTVYGYMLPYSFVNQLFEKSDVVEAYTSSSVDCGGCEGLFVWDDCQGVRLSPDEYGRYTATAGWRCGVSSNCYAALVYFDWSGSGRMAEPRLYKVTKIDGVQSSGDGTPLGGLYSYYDLSNNLIGGPRFLEDTGQCCNGIHFFSGAPFTLVFEVELCD